MNTTTGFHGDDGFVELCNFGLCGWRSKPLVIGRDGPKDDVMAKLKAFGLEHTRMVHAGDWDEGSAFVVW